MTEERKKKGERVNRTEKMRETGGKAYYLSPIGIIEIVGNNRGVSRLSFVGKRKNRSAAVPAHVGECLAQLDEYFKGKRKKFSVKLDLGGTVFQKRVWRALLRIPLGQTASYREIAEAVGNRKAVRAVGAANGVNPVAILIPCHRVIGSDGSLVGYGSGLWRKKWLLAHERRFGRRVTGEKGNFHSSFRSARQSMSRRASGTRENG